VTGSVLLASAGAIVVLMLGTWLLSLAWRDASIVDPVWPLGFVVVAWVTRAVAAGHGDPTRQWVLVAMTTIWGLRLSGYLAWRKHGAPEDPRYQAMRRHFGARFGLISLVTVFALQGTLMWIVSLPVQLGQTERSPELGALAFAGIALWLLGVTFESVGDAQLARFKADPASEGQVMDRGLWRYTRHPNYFGDTCVWWGIALVAAETGVGAIGIVGAVVMTVLLVRVSGVPMLERSMAKRRPGYTEYVARTSAFIPRPPRRA
jgi:steroid 5-alpha reductase family enzyme